MRLLDASLSRRLMLAAGALIAAALLIAAIVIYFALHRFVQGQIDQRLDTHILFLSSMLRADSGGTLRLDGTADGPPFDRMRRGWYWQISGPKNVIRSRSLDDATLKPPDISGRPLPPPPPIPPPEGDRPPPGERPAPADGAGPYGEAIHYRIKGVSVAGVHATIVASSPRAAVSGPLRDAMLTLGIALGALGIALVLAMLVQVRLGLRPLERLRQAVADVRAGHSDRVPERQPREVQPMAAELNALLEQNAANLERARKHVANLAHGLKTPLATLAIALPKDTRGTKELHELVALMERRIRHHLGRARAAALSGPVRSRTQLAPRVADLALVLAKANADKDVAFNSDVAHDMAVACEAQDVDEMLGNVLENAFHWCRSRVAVRAREEGRFTALEIDDDGPGLTSAQMAQAMQAGRRLDESSPGFGFGLSITRELAELYAGSLTLNKAALGGLRVTIYLPAAAGR
ncbi:ATP-binding protein [Rhodoplanes sp. Z2-YC6860]|uniref:ATP-binding protein n=1 Tax=Rhodoplanes sp. Z2-YC6860 TaxID=674703 RepID=UPI00078E2F63|nr:HAMP domain-containing sensor histidine kinase [Rhodoplanes sp. Z2-YC6860]AMN44987.1 integral membrane sensor signal transduction histidine kinase [Rhodoplanes sp. Z2-YC6860]